MAAAAPTTTAEGGAEAGEEEKVLMDGETPVLRPTAAEYESYIEVKAELQEAVRKQGSIVFIARSETGAVGLLNQGATCYLNSLLQVLFMTPEFRYAVYQFGTGREQEPDQAAPAPPNTDAEAASSKQQEQQQPQLEQGAARRAVAQGPGIASKPAAPPAPDAGARQRSRQEEIDATSIPAQLQALFARLQLSERAAVSTKPLTKSFGWSSGEAFQQHDVQELCRVLFQAMESYGAGTNSNNYDMAQTLTQLFGGRMVDTLFCPECKGGRAIVEDFMDVQLSIEGMSTLEDAFANFVAEEQLDDDNRWCCCTCGERVRAIKSMRLSSIPPIFSVHLKRFVFDLQTMRRRKLTEPINIPRTIDMAPFVQPPRSTSTSSDASGDGDGDGDGDGNGGDTSSPSAKSGDKNEYELYGMLIHSGTAHGGHYHAFIRHSFDPARWFDFNDAYVTELSQEDVERLFSEDSEAERDADKPEIGDGSDEKKPSDSKSSKERDADDDAVADSKSSDPTAKDVDGKKGDVGGGSSSSSSSSDPCAAVSEGKQLEKSSGQTVGAADSKGAKGEDCVLTSPTELVTRASRHYAASNCYMLLFRKTGWCYDPSAADSMATAIATAASTATTAGHDPAKLQSFQQALAQWERTLAGSVPRHLREEIVADNELYLKLRRAFNVHKHMVNIEVYISAGGGSGGGGALAATGNSSGSIPNNLGDVPESTRSSFTDTQASQLSQISQAFQAQPISIAFDMHKLDTLQEAVEQARTRWIAERARLMEQQMQETAATPPPIPSVVGDSRVGTPLSASDATVVGLGELREGLLPASVSAESVTNVDDEDMRSETTGTGAATGNWCPVPHSRSNSPFLTGAQPGVAGPVPPATDIVDLNRIPPEQCRLRRYNVFAKRVGETFGGKENCTLQELGFGAGATLILESRDKNEVFTEFNPREMQICVTRWNPELQQIVMDAANTAELTVPGEQHATVGALRSVVAEHFGVPRGRVALARLDTGAASSAGSEALDVDSRVLRRDHHIWSGDQVVFEEIPDPRRLAPAAALAAATAAAMVDTAPDRDGTDTGFGASGISPSAGDTGLNVDIGSTRSESVGDGQDARAGTGLGPCATTADHDEEELNTLYRTYRPTCLDLFEAMHSTITVTFNHPDEPDDADGKHMLTTTLDTKLADIRLEISDMLSLDPHSFHFKRNMRAPQFKDEDRTLRALAIVDRSKLFVAHGAPCRPGEHVVEFFLMEGTNKFNPLFDMPVDERWSVARLKREVVLRLPDWLQQEQTSPRPHGDGEDSADAGAEVEVMRRDPRTLRLRERKPRQMGSILRDNRTVLSSIVGLCDGKRVAVQVLDRPETVGPDDLIVQIQKLHFKAKKMGEPEEIVVNRNLSAPDLLAELASRFPDMTEPVPEEVAAAAEAAAAAAPGPPKPDSTFGGLDIAKCFKMAKANTFGPKVTLKTSLKLAWNDSRWLSSECIGRAPLSLRDGALVLVRSEKDLQEALAEMRARRQQREASGGAAEKTRRTRGGGQVGRAGASRFARSALKAMPEQGLRIQNYSEHAATAAAAADADKAAEVDADTAAADAKQGPVENVVVEVASATPSVSVSASADANVDAGEGSAGDEPKLTADTDQ